MDFSDSSTPMSFQEAARTIRLIDDQEKASRILDWIKDLLRKENSMEDQIDRLDKTLNNKEYHIVCQEEELYQSKQLIESLNDQLASRDNLSGQIEEATKEVTDWKKKYNNVAEVSAQQIAALEDYISKIEKEELPEVVDHLRKSLKLTESKYRKLKRRYVELRKQENQVNSLEETVKASEEKLAELQKELETEKEKQGVLSDEEKMRMMSLELVLEKYQIKHVRFVEMAENAKAKTSQLSEDNQKQVEKYKALKKKCGELSIKKRTLDEEIEKICARLTCIHPEEFQLRCLLERQELMDHYTDVNEKYEKIKESEQQNARKLAELEKKLKEKECEIEDLIKEMFAKEVELKKELCKQSSLCMRQRDESNMENFLLKKQLEKQEKKSKAALEKEKAMNAELREDIAELALKMETMGVEEISSDEEEKEEEKKEEEEKQQEGEEEEEFETVNESDLDEQ